MLDCANFIFRFDDLTIYGYFSPTGLRQLYLYQQGERKPYILHERPNIVAGKQLTLQLEQYFSGVKVDFRNIPLDLRANSPFYLNVWNALRTVEWGTVITYQALAKRAGYGPQYARAVGNAVAKNPVPIIIPCHRVIQTDGSLGGFSAGLEWKKRLLSIEGILK